MKTCFKCKSAKSEDAFTKDKSTKDGFSFYCSDCSHRMRRSIPLFTRRLRRVKHKYGLEPEQYIKLIESCNGCCEICGINTTLGVDHNHSTGQVRGILCRMCNAGIGHLRDSPELMIRVVAYLQKYLSVVKTRYFSSDSRLRCRECQRLHRLDEYHDDKGVFQGDICLLCSHPKCWEEMNTTLGDGNVEECKRRYRLLYRELYRIVHEANNKCILCGAIESLVIDHCHNNEIARGMVCHTCNSGLGMFQDNITNIIRASQYINRTANGANLHTTPCSQPFQPT